MNMKKEQIKTLYFIYINTKTELSFFEFLMSKFATVNVHEISELYNCCINSWLMTDEKTFDSKYFYNWLLNVGLFD
jgi:hypothetical protein